jgi:hypothetical protein
LTAARPVCNFLVHFSLVKGLQIVIERGEEPLIPRFVQGRKTGGSRSSDLWIVLSGTIKSFEDLLLYLVGMLQRILGLREEKFQCCG